MAENSGSTPASGGNNAYQGPAANDTFSGGGGNDRLLGGDGNDRISGDAPVAGQWTYGVYTRDFSSSSNQTGLISGGTLLGTGYVDDFNVLALRNAVTGTPQGTNQDDYGVIYQSTLNIQTTGTYNFSLNSDDGSRIIIRDAAGNIVFNLDNDESFVLFLNSQSGSVILQAGQTYTIEVYYWENWGDSTLSATVSGPGISSTNLATSSLLGTPPLATGHVDGADSLYGQAGNDTLTGGGGNDLLFGGTESDSILGGAGNDLVDGGSGNDQLYGDAGDDTILGGTGDDSAFGGAGNDSMLGDDGNDTLYYSTGNDTVFGGAGDDVIDDVAFDQLSGANLIYGGDGNDHAWTGNDADSVYGGAGNDVLEGESGNDSIYGGAGADLVYGGADRDTIVIGSGDFTAGDFVDGGGSGDDFDTLDLSGYGWQRTDIVFTSSDHQSGTVTFYDESGAVIGTMNFAEIENVVPCFTAGTLIETPSGPRPVESLKPGDQVLTLDDGPQTLRWVGKRSLGVAALLADPSLQPVEIAAGAIDVGVPSRRITVSPQHRVLFGGASCELYFGATETLVPAVHLLGRAGVRQRIRPVTYVHLLFDKHQIVKAHGLWSESFQPGQRTLFGLPDLQREELLSLFPALEFSGSYPAARITLKAHETRVLLSV